MPPVPALSRPGMQSFKIAGPSNPGDTMSVSTEASVCAAHANSLSEELEAWVMNGGRRHSLALLVFLVIITKRHSGTRIVLVFVFKPCATHDAQRIWPTGRFTTHIVKEGFKNAGGASEPLCSQARAGAG